MLTSMGTWSIHDRVPTMCAQTCYWIVFVATIAFVQMVLVTWSAEWRQDTASLIDDDALWSVAGIRPSAIQRPTSQPLSQLGPMAACLAHPDPFSPQSEYSLHDTHHRPGGPIFYVQHVIDREQPLTVSQSRYREAKRYALELAQSYGGSAVMRDSSRTPHLTPNAFFDDAEETLLRLASCYVEYAKPSSEDHVTSLAVYPATSWIWLDPSMPVASVEDGKADLLSQHDHTWKEIAIARIGIYTASLDTNTASHTSSAASAHAHSLELVDAVVNAWLNRSPSTDDTSNSNSDLRRRVADTSGNGHPDKIHNLQDLVAAGLFAQLRRTAVDKE